MDGQYTGCPERKVENKQPVFLSWDVYLLLLLRTLDYRTHTNLPFSPPFLLRLLDCELVGSPASGLVLNYTTGFQVLQLVDSIGLTSSHTHTHTFNHT